MPRNTSNQAGFTLIELLTVVAIIAILSAICLQIFIELRKRGYDGRALQDLRNVANAEESYFAATESYKACASSADCAAALPGIAQISSGVTLAITATATGFTGTSTHPTGSGIIYSWSSQQGGLQK